MRNVILVLVALILSGCVASGNSELVTLEKELQDLQDSIQQNEESIDALKEELATMESPQIIPITEALAQQLIRADMFYWTRTRELANPQFITYDSIADTTTIQFLRVNLKMIIEGRIPDKIVVNCSALGIDFGYQTSETIDGIASYFIMSNSWGFQEIIGKRSIVRGHDMDSILNETQQAEVNAFLSRKIIFVEGN